MKQLHTECLGSLSWSQKKYCGELWIPMREIFLSEGAELKSFIVYDTSWPYSEEDAEKKIDLNTWLPKIREQWIQKRDDVEVYI
jgi:phosphomethylpyrimidine synthase